MSSEAGEAICREMLKDHFVVSPSFASKMKTTTEARSKFLVTDIREAGKPFVEDGWAERKKTGTWLLQCDEIINISLPLAQRYDEKNINNKSATLQLNVTDGHTSIMAIVREPIDNLRPNSAPGIKLVIHEAPISHGVILLNQSTCFVCGGWSERLVHNQNVATSLLLTKGAK